MNKFYKGITTLVLISLISSPISTFALEKTETVFSKLKSDGEVISTDYNVSLSKLDKGEVVDYTKLDNIKNINGEEKFSKDSEKLTWKSTGRDIFYKGSLNSELPISVSVKYYLDGHELSLKDIKGKSGKVSEVFTFKNKEYDSESSMYTPFVVSLVSVINSKNNSNINISNGKVINTGNKTIVTGISAPGLYDSVNISEFKSLDQITLSYDTEKFSMNEVYFVISPKLLEEVDISNLDKLSGVKDGISTLQNGVNELESGSLTLSSGSDSLTLGLTTLNNGLKSAKDGSNKLYEGLSQVEKGTVKINSLTTLVDELYNNYLKNEELLNNIKSGVTEQQLRDGINNATLAKTNLENKLSEVNSAISMLEGLDVLTEEQNVQLNTLKGQKQQLEEGISKYEQGISEAQSNLSTLPLAAAKISGADEVISKVLCGILGVSDMSDVNLETINTFKLQINGLTSGISELCEGAKNLNKGLDELYTGSNSLVEGSNKISDGNKKLHEGITKLNNEGISKLNDYGNKISNTSQRVETLINLSKNYKGFTSNNADKVIFIYKLEK